MRKVLEGNYYNHTYSDVHDAIKEVIERARRKWEEENPAHVDRVNLRAPATRRARPRPQGSSSQQQAPAASMTAPPPRPTKRASAGFRPPKIDPADMVDIHDYSPWLNNVFFDFENMASIKAEAEAEIVRVMKQFNLTNKTWAGLPDLGPINNTFAAITLRTHYDLPAVRSKGLAPVINQLLPPVLFEYAYARYNVPEVIKQCEEALQLRRLLNHALDKFATPVIVKGAKKKMVTKKAFIWPDGLGCTNASLGIPNNCVPPAMSFSIAQLLDQLHELRRVTVVESHIFNHIKSAVGMPESSGWSIRANKPAPRVVDETVYNALATVHWVSPPSVLSILPILSILLILLILPILRFVSFNLSFCRLPWLLSIVAVTQVMHMNHQRNVARMKDIAGWSSKNVAEVADLETLLQFDVSEYSPPAPFRLPEGYRVVRDIYTTGKPPYSLLLNLSDDEDEGKNEDEDEDDEHVNPSVGGRVKKVLKKPAEEDGSEGEDDGEKKAQVAPGGTHGQSLSAATSKPKPKPKPRATATKTASQAKATKEEPSAAASTAHRKGKLRLAKLEEPEDVVMEEEVIEVDEPEADDGDVPMAVEGVERVERVERVEGVEGVEEIQDVDVDMDADNAPQAAPAPTASRKRAATPRQSGGDPADPSPPIGKSPPSKRLRAGSTSASAKTPPPTQLPITPSRQRTPIVVSPSAQRHNMQALSALVEGNDGDADNEDSEEEGDELPVPGPGAADAPDDVIESEEHLAMLEQLTMVEEPPATQLSASADPAAIVPDDDIEEADGDAEEEDEIEEIDEGRPLPVPRTVRKGK